MIGLDTNVVVRFLTQDDVVQSAQAATVFASLTEEEPGFLCREVMVELVWVLERSYHLSRTDIAGAIDELLASREIVVEEADRVGLATELYRQGGAGFSDQMIAIGGRDAGCDMVLTFDRKAIASTGMKSAPTHG